MVPAAVVGALDGLVDRAVPARPAAAAARRWLARTGPGWPAVTGRRGRRRPDASAVARGPVVDRGQRRASGRATARPASVAEAPDAAPTAAPAAVAATARARRGIAREREAGDLGREDRRQGGSGAGTGAGADVGKPCPEHRRRGRRAPWLGRPDRRGTMVPAVTPQSVGSAAGAVRTGSVGRQLPARGLRRSPPGGSSLKPAAHGPWPATTYGDVSTDSNVSGRSRTTPRRRRPSPGAAHTSRGCGR